MRFFLRALLTALCAISLGVIALSFSGVQTALLNRWLAQRAVPASVDRLVVGWNTFRIEGARVSLPAGELRVPRAAGQLDLPELIGGGLHMRRCVLDALELDLNAPDLPQPSPDLGSSESVRFGLAALQDALVLPFPLAIDELQATGQVRLNLANRPREHNQLAFAIQGAVSPRQPSRLDFTLRAVREDGNGAVGSLQVRSALTLRFAEPTRLEGAVLTTNLSAVGERFPNGAVLNARFELANDRNGLSLDAHAYGAGDSDRRELLNIRAGTDPTNGSVKGRWAVDVNQSDLAPYSLGVEPPPFSLTGNGGFVLADGLRVAGELDLLLPAPGTLDPRVNGLGEARVRGIFDVHRLRDRWRIHRVNTRLGIGGLVVASQLLQMVEWQPASRAWAVANPEGDVLNVEWQGLTAAAVRPFLPEILWEGRVGPGSAAIKLLPTGVVVRSQKPQRIDDLEINRGGRALLGPLNLRFDYEWTGSAGGWQLELPRVTLEAGDARVASLSGKVRQSRQTPWEASMEADFELARIQGLWRPSPGLALLQSGLAHTRLAVSSAQKDLWQLQLDLTLSGATLATDRVLPNLSTSARVDFNRTGSLDLEIPLELRTPRGRTDLLILSHATGWPKAPQFETVVTSKTADADSLMAWWGVYQAVLPEAREPVIERPSDTPESTRSPFWEGAQGTIRMALASVDWPKRKDPIQIELHAEADQRTLVLKQVQVSSPDGTSLEAKAEILFNPLESPRARYRYSAAGRARETDPAPFLQVLDPSRPPLVEGKFDLDFSVSGSAGAPSELVDQTQATLVLTGRRGRFHAFDEAVRQVDFGRLVGNGSAFANLVGRATSLFTNVDRRINAGNQFMRRLAGLEYDQATFEIALRPGREIDVREFSLISPELRLIGSGTLQAQPGLPWAQRALRLSVALSVRGANERDLRTLGLLGDAADSLGYFSLGQPIRVDGTLRDLAARNLTEIITSAIER